MDHSEFVFLSGQGGLEFAKELGLETVEDNYFFTEFRYKQLQEAKRYNVAQLDHTESREDKHGTVGAVAMDQAGNLAAATSTGGLTNKKYGRIGDSAIIGAGTYANNASCAVSGTGYGEFYIRGVVAYDIAALIEYRGLSLKEACDIVIEKQEKMGGDGGVVAIDRHGNIALPFNSEGMYRAWKSAGKEAAVMIYRDI
jgi:beta-aspartyl-peptidase (threonine type)